MFKKYFRKWFFFFKINDKTFDLMDNLNSIDSDLQIPYSIGNRTIKLLTLVNSYKSL